MIHHRQIRRLVAAGAAVMALALAGSAAAQGGGILNPNAPANTNTNAIAPDSAAPQPNVRKQYPVWLGFVVIFVIIAAIMGVSLIPSKRSHQD